MQCSLTVSDIIEIIGIISSTTVSIVAVAISLVSLRQNSKMIEEANRPNIQIYNGYIGSPPDLFVIYKVFCPIANIFYIAIDYFKIVGG